MIATIPASCAGHDQKKLGRAGRLEHGGIERVACAFTGPDHELKRAKITLAGLERGPEERLALFSGCFRAASQHQCVTKHHHALAVPVIEMPDPQPFIDK